MKRSNPTRPVKDLACVILLAALLSISPTSAGDDPEESKYRNRHDFNEGTIFLCENSQGRPSLFVVVMRDNNHFGRWFLQEVAPVDKLSHDVRVGFSFPETASASLVIESSASHSVYRQSVDHTSGTSDCGWGPFDTGGTVFSRAKVTADLQGPLYSASQTAPVPLVDVDHGKIHMT